MPVVRHYRAAAAAIPLSIVSVAFPAYLWLGADGVVPGELVGLVVFLLVCAGAAGAVATGLGLLAWRVWWAWPAVVLGMIGSVACLVIISALVLLSLFAGL